MFCMPQAWSCSASSRAGSHSSSCTSSHHCGLSVKTSTRKTKGSLINKLQHWLSFIVFGSVWSIYKVVSGSFLTNVTKKSLWKLVPEFPWRCVFQICLRSCDCFVVMRCLLEEGEQSVTVEARIESRAANDPLVFTITNYAPTRAFSWLKEPTGAFTFKTLC